MIGSLQQSQLSAEASQVSTLEIAIPPVVEEKELRMKVGQRGMNLVDVSPFMSFCEQLFV